jgi:hypothetical protein
MKARIMARKKGYAVRVLSARPVEGEELRELAHTLQNQKCVTRAIVRGQEILLRTRDRGRKVRQLLEAVSNRFLTNLVSTPARKRVRKPALRRKPTFNRKEAFDLTYEVA